MMRLVGRRKKEKQAEKQREQQEEEERRKREQEQHDQYSADGTPRSPKLVPRNFFECPMSDLIILVASMLQELVQLNDALPFESNQLTRFHSRSPPQISIHDYMVRIVKFCSLEKSILLSIIYYIDLLCTTYAKFNINSLTVHRFMITAAVVGTKGLCDSFCTNKHYAKVGGLTKVELNLLEVEFLVRVDYRIVPKDTLLDQYYERMVARLSSQYAFADDQVLSQDDEQQQEQDLETTAPTTAPTAQPVTTVDPANSPTLTPSEIAHNEGRRNRSSSLKRRSVTEVIPNTSIHHPEEPRATPLVGSPASMKRVKHL